MLLDPFEEQLDLPTAAVEFADGECWQGEIVGQQHDRLARVGIADLDAAQRLGKTFAGVVDVENNRLVADEIGAAIDVCGIAPREIQIRTSPDNEESTGIVKAMQALEIDVSAVHNIKGDWLGQEVT